MNLKLKLSYIVFFFVIFFYYSAINYLTFNINYYDFGINISKIYKDTDIFSFILRPVLILFKPLIYIDNIFIVPFTLIFLNIIGVLMPMLFFINKKKLDLLFFLYPIIFIIGTLVNSGFHTDVFYIFFGIQNLIFFKESKYKSFVLTLIVIFILKTPLFFIHLILLFSIFYEKFIIRKNIFLFLITFISICVLFFADFKESIYFFLHIFLLVIPFYFFLKEKLFFLLVYLFLTLIIFFINYKLLNINNHFTVVFLTFSLFLILTNKKINFKINNPAIIYFFFMIILNTFYFSNSIFSLRTDNLSGFLYSKKNTDDYLNFIEYAKKLDSNYIIYQNNAFVHFYNNPSVKYKDLNPDFKNYIKNKENIILLTKEQPFFIGDQKCNLDLNLCKESIDKISNIKPIEILKIIEKNFVSIYTFGNLKVYKSKL